MALPQVTRPDRKESPCVLVSFLRNPQKGLITLVDLVRVERSAMLAIQRYVNVTATKLLFLDPDLFAGLLLVVRQRHLGVLCGSLHQNKTFDIDLALVTLGHPDAIMTLGWNRHPALALKSRATLGLMLAEDTIRDPLVAHAVRDHLRGDLEPIFIFVHHVNEVIRKTGSGLRRSEEHTS